MKKLIPILLLVIVLAILSTGILGCASVAGDRVSVHSQRHNSAHTECAASDDLNASCEAACDRRNTLEKKERFQDLDDNPRHSLYFNS